jgi:hypothetical protein
VVFVVCISVETIVCIYTYILQQSPKNTNG